MTTSRAPWRTRSETSIPCWRSRRRRGGGAGGIVAGDHPALAGGDALARMEREAGERPQRADGSAAVGGADGARGVLDDLQAVAPCELEQRVHVGRQPELVHGHDRLRPLADGALYSGR